MNTKKPVRRPRTTCDGHLYAFPNFEQTCNVDCLAQDAEPHVRKCAHIDSRQRGRLRPLDAKL